MSGEKNYNVITVENGVPIKAWTRGVTLEDQARKQLRTSLSFLSSSNGLRPCPTFTGESAPPLAA